MSDTKHEAYAHYVWATKRREPILAAEWEANLHALIASLATKAGCAVLAVNGMPDHVHLLVRESKTQLHWQVMQSVKGVSSQFISDRLHAGKEGMAANWQSGYAVFTVSPSQVVGVRRYVERQKERHAAGRLWRSCEGDGVDGGAALHGRSVVLTAGRVAEATVVYAGGDAVGKRVIARRAGYGRLGRVVRRRRAGT